MPTTLPVRHSSILQLNIEAEGTVDTLKTPLEGGVLIMKLGRFEFVALKHQLGRARTCFQIPVVGVLSSQSSPRIHFSYVCVEVADSHAGERRDALCARS